MRVCVLVVSVVVFCCCCCCFSCCCCCCLCLCFCSCCCCDCRCFSCCLGLCFCLCFCFCCSVSAADSAVVDSIVTFVSVVVVTLAVAISVVAVVAVELVCVCVRASCDRHLSIWSSFNARKILSTILSSTASSVPVGSSPLRCLGSAHRSLHAAMFVFTVFVMSAYGYDCNLFLYIFCAHSKEFGLCSSVCISLCIMP